VAGGGVYGATKFAIEGLRSDAGFQVGPDAVAMVADKLTAFATNWRRGVPSRQPREVQKDIDPDLAMDLVFGPIMWRLVSGRRPLTEDEADAFVNSVLNGLRATTG
jgi:hypothetical protein